ncbi:lipopolysaccharide biosynthesis protein [Amaricoccus tamworthensis]|uniref:lipopolysaccharide biosynthesis protein n=1 Tax=Amaricoccus tamworthensis TaxID=57002 RepID=UPI003C7B9144
MMRLGKAAGFSTRLRGMIVWSILGQAFYVSSQFCILILLTRFAEIEDVGRFGLAAAIATPVFFFFNLGLRFNQATDMSDSFGFRDFLLLRSVTTLCGLVTIGGIAVFAAPDTETLYFIALVSITRAVDMLSDLMYGVFQKNNRIDLMTVSQILRGVLSISAFAFILLFNGSVTLALFSNFLSWLVVLAVFDAPQALRHIEKTPRRATLSETWRLAVNSAPLGAALLVTSLGGVMPRLLLAQFVGLESLGYFTAVAYINQAAKMLFQALDRAVVGHLARLWHEGQSGEFHGLLLKLGALLSGSVFVAAFVMLPYNNPILSFVFGLDFDGYGDLMFLILISIAFNAPCQVYQNALIAQRKFRLQLLNRITYTVFITVFCTMGIMFFGLNGAAIGMVGASLVQIPVLYWIIGGRRTSAARGGGNV